MLLSYFRCRYFVVPKARYSWKCCSLGFENLSLFHYLFISVVFKEISSFTDRIHDVRIKWVTKKVKQLIKIKVRNPCPSCVICEGVCSYKESQWGNVKTLKKTQNQQNRRKVTQDTSFPGKFCFLCQKISCLKKLRSNSSSFKGCVHYIFARLICMSKRQHL